MCGEPLPHAGEHLVERGLIVRIVEQAPRLVLGCGQRDQDGLLT
jgi:hypothetical protein